MKTLLLSLACFCYSASIAQLQPKLHIVWQRSLGGSGDDEARVVVRTADSGYAVTGWTGSNDGDVTGNHGGDDIRVVKLDSNGNTLWQKCYGGSQNDHANAMRATRDGGVIIAGDTWSNDGDVTGNDGGKDGWVLKLDSLGNIEWQKCIGQSSQSNSGTAVQVAQDGGYIVAGYADSSAWVAKLTMDGNIEWQTQAGSTNEKFYAVDTTLDGGFIAVGHNSKTNGQSYWMAKFDKTGNTQWSSFPKEGGVNALIGTGTIYKVNCLANGGYFIAGAEVVPGSFNDHFVLYLDSLCQRTGGGLGLGTDPKYTADVKLLGQQPYINFITAFIIKNNAAHGNYNIYTEDWPGAQLSGPFGGSDTDRIYSIETGLVANEYVFAGISNSNDGDVSGNHGGYDWWVVKLSADSTVMPVTFLSFTAQKQKAGVLLQWQTATELNSHHFNIQRSMDGAQFTTIGSKQAAGSSNTIQSYNYLDVNAEALNATALYYRIQEVDADGRASLSNIAKVGFDGDRQLFSVAPNPVTNVIRLRSTGNASNAVVRITAADGKVVYSTTKNFTAAAITEIPITTLAKGVYVLTIQAAGVTTTLKVVKE